MSRLASEAGARVIAISRRQSSLDLARHYGAAETIVMNDHWRILEDVKRLTDGRGCDRVIECVGKQWPLDLAGELVREGGRLVIAGYHQDGARQVNMQMWNWRGLDVINAHERETARYVTGIRRAVEAGCAATQEPKDEFWGDRFAKVTDPFGHQWAFATHVEDVSPEEMERRLGEMMKGGC